MNTGHLAGITTIPVGVRGVIPQDNLGVVQLQSFWRTHHAGRHQRTRQAVNSTHQSARAELHYTPLWHSVDNAILLGWLNTVVLIIRVEFLHIVDQFHLERLGTLFIITIYAECPCAQIQVPRFWIHPYYYLDLD
jgi:hypothetical protein